MNTMWALAAAMSLGMAAHAAQDGGMPPQVESQQASISAKVDSIDYAGRHVTLRGEGGRTQSFAVPPEVKNFDQIKKGDNVVVDYYRSVLVEMAQPGEEPKAPSAKDNVKVAPPGNKPAAMQARVTRATVTVRSIDKVDGTVTVALPSGETRTVVVSEARRPLLDKIKPGDNISVTLTEAVAVAVRKP